MHVLDTKHVWELSQLVAEAVYSDVSPAPEYSFNVACQIFGTAAHESGGFRWCRQRGYSFNDAHGGWGICQVQPGSLATSLKRLERNETLRTNVQALLPHPIDMLIAKKWDTPKEQRLHLRQILLLSCGSALLSLILCRLHYYGFKAPIPDDLHAQARTWKEQYNTAAGKGSEEQYVSNYVNYCVTLTHGKKTEGV